MEQVRNGRGPLLNSALSEFKLYEIQALAAKLDTWAVEYVDILRNIPEKIQKGRIKRQTHDSKPNRSATFIPRSAIALESGYQPKRIGSEERKEENDQIRSSNLQDQNARCQPQGLKVIDKLEDSVDEERGGSLIGSFNGVGNSNMGISGKRGKGDVNETAARHSENSRKRVHERDYFSVPCLHGLANGVPPDPYCPNIADHGRKHLRRPYFLSLLREQLPHDRGHVTDCEPLWIGGSRGAIFKVTLTAHGYTVIAKGVQLHDAPHLQHEARVYRHLRNIQGIHNLVCLGSATFLPYYHNGGKFVRFLFQRFARVSVLRVVNNKETKSSFLSNMNQALGAIHRLRVLHCDAMYRNIMVDEESGRVHIVDFERAKILPKKQKGVTKKKLSPSAERNSKAMEIRIDFLTTKELIHALADMALVLKFRCHAQLEKTAQFRVANFPCK